MWVQIFHWAERFGSPTRASGKMVYYLIFISYDKQRTVGFCVAPFAADY